MYTIIRADLALNCNLSTVKNRDGSRTMQLATVESVPVEPDNLKPFTTRLRANCTTNRSMLLCKTR